MLRRSKTTKPERCAGGNILAMRCRFAGTELPVGGAGQLREVLLPDVEPPQQRQADGAAALMANDPVEDDPAVAVEELRSRRSGRRVMVDPRPLDLGTIPLRRRIVDGQEQSAAGVDSISEQAEDDGGHSSGLATDTAEEVVVGAEVLPNAGGPPPTGDGAAAVGQEDADDDLSQPPGTAAMQRGGQGGDPGDPLGGQSDGGHSRPPWCDSDGLNTTIVPGGRGLSHDRTIRQSSELAKCSC